MIEKIENIEELMNNEPSTKILEGFEAIHIALSLASTGNTDLIKLIEDVR